MMGLGLSLGQIWPRNRLEFCRAERERMKGSQMRLCPISSPLKGPMGQMKALPSIVGLLRVSGWPIYLGLPIFIFILFLLKWNGPFVGYLSCLDVYACKMVHFFILCFGMFLTAAFILHFH